MIYYIYVLQNKINNKIYVGQTNNLSKRKREHKAKDRLHTKGTPVYHAIAKYGFDNFIMTSIEEHDNTSDTDESEEFWIQFFQSRKRDFGYNLAEGGHVNRGFKHSDEFKKQKSIQMKEFFKTHKPHNYGKEVTKELKEHLSNMWDGEKSLNAKFNNKQIKDIRRMYTIDLVSQSEIARRYGVSSTTISAIVKYKTYKNVI